MLLVICSGVAPEFCLLKPKSDPSATDVIDADSVRFELTFLYSLGAFPLGHTTILFSGNRNRTCESLAHATVFPFDYEPHIGGAR